jgi:cyclase
LVSKRIIPCLDVKDGKVVKGTNFVNLIDAGDAVELAERYSKEGADELVFLDITASAEKRKTLLYLVEKVAKAIRIPFTVGGGISELQDIESLLKAGADKVSLNSSIVRNPSLITEASRRFGSQAIVAAIDTKRNISGVNKVFVKGGREETELEGLSWCQRAAELGAGEILLTSMDKDGTKDGYDVEFLKKVTSGVSIPVIASGGAGKKEDFLDAFKTAGVDACLAASLFHFSILDIKELKQYLRENNIKVRL